MTKFLSLKSLLAVTLGALAGFSYWYFIGCNSGTCLITSVWYHSTLYGALMGYLLVSSFSKEPKPGN